MNLNNLKTFEKTAMLLRILCYTVSIYHVKGVSFLTFPICCLKQPPQFDTLPIAKIIHYPLEQRDYKPFAQGILALYQNTLYLRLWAFETPPEPESRITACLYLPNLLYVQAAPDAHTLLWNGVPLPPDSYTCHPFTGDDLQGKYWGALFAVPLSELPGAVLPAPIGRIPGNLYKSSSGSRPHIGSFFPMLNPETPYTETNMGQFTLMEF